jgi:hypothetical protein
MQIITSIVLCSWFDVIVAGLCLLLFLWATSRKQSSHSTDCNYDDRCGACKTPHSDTRKPFSSVAEGLCGDWNDEIRYVCTKPDGHDGNHGVQGAEPVVEWPRKEETKGKQ